MNHTKLRPPTKDMRVKAHATPYGVLTSITTTDEDGRSVTVYSNIHENTVLERNGMRNDGTFGVIDDLSVNYDGNRLLKVTDDAESLNYNGALDFNDGADMTAEYEYDSTGALTKDRNRGITGITYDLGHNPQTIVMNGGQIVNDYTSDGRKLCSTQSTGMTTTTDMYVDGLIIRNGASLMWQFDGGYVALGTNNYYPYGSEMTMTPPAQLTSNPNWQPYRFTGKELVRQNDLNMYDFGARLYDVAGVPVWTSMDPLCEKNYDFSPYVYCKDNPVNAIDPDGKDGIFIAFPDYKISTPIGKIGGLGHAGVLLINNKTGFTKYYEYGRYDSENRGVVRSFSVPNVDIDKNGKPTTKSLNTVMKAVSEKAGHGGRIEGAYVKSDNFDAMNDYASDKLKENSDSNRKAYSLLNNNCGTFAADVLTADDDVEKKAPSIIDPRPNSIVKEFQKEFDTINYNPTKTNQ